MQEEIEHKTVNFAISTVKLSARTLLKGAQFFLRQYDKSASQGKQSMNRLIRQNRGVTNLEIEKTGIKDELLKQLMDFHAYDLLHRDAALALTIAPENTKAYYWLIRSYQKQHMDEMAAGELAAAKQKLPEDEYQKLLNSLER